MPTGHWKDRPYGDRPSGAAALRAKLEAAVALLIEASADLTAYVEADYPPEGCAQYQDIARRRHRDLELVRRIDATLAQIKGADHE